MKHKHTLLGMTVIIDHNAEPSTVRLVDFSKMPPVAICHGEQKSAKIRQEMDRYAKENGIIIPIEKEA